MARALAAFMLALCVGMDVEAGSLVRIGTNVWPGYEPMYLAAERNQWERRHGVRLVEYRSASEVLRAFRNRALEAAALTLDEVLILLEAELPLRVVTILDVSHGGDVILGSSDMQSFTELRGRRVGVESGALGAYVLSRALEMHDMRLDDVEIIHMDVSQHEHAFLEHRVDAVVTFEPVRTRLLGRGARELFSSAQIPGEIVDVLVVHADVLARDGDLVATLVDEWFEALDYMQAEPRAAAAFTARRLRISPDEVIASYAGLEFPDVERNREMLGGGLDSSITRLRDVLVAHELLSADVAIGPLLQPDCLPD